MTPLKYIAVFAAVYLTSAPAWAVKVLQCVDEKGNKTYQNYCPPGSKPVGEKQYSTATGTPAPGTASLTATLYVIPDCDTCDQVKEFLSIRHIGVTEKNVSEDIKLQDELKQKNKGDLRVPVLLIGDKVLNGYNRSELLQALASAGYKEEAEQPASNKP